MADQAERVILEAEDQVTPVVGQANAGLDSFEKKAESTHGKIIRITDQTRSSIQRLIASLEKQAEVYGKSGVDRLISQRDQLLQRYAKEPAAIDAITRSYEKMIAEQKKIDSEAKSEGLGGKVKQFIENPLQGAKSALGGVVSGMGQRCAAYPFTELSWDQAHCRYLMGWYYSGWPWQREYLVARRTGVPLIKFWAYDHLCLFGWPLPLPVAAANPSFI